MPCSSAEKQQLLVEQAMTTLNYDASRAWHSKPSHMFLRRLRERQRPESDRLP